MKARCGNECGECPLRSLAETDDKIFTRFVKLRWERAMGVTLDESDLRCGGCGSERMFRYCASCYMAKCGSEKGVERCEQCPAHPCVRLSKYREWFESTKERYWWGRDFSPEVRGIPKSGLLAAQGLKEALWDALYEPSDEKAEAVLRTYAERPGDIVIGLFVSDQVLGMLGAREDAGMEILHLGVRREFRRLGAGGLLLAHLRRLHPDAEIRACTDADALGFYRKMGCSIARIRVRKGQAEYERFRCVLPRTPRRRRH